MTYCPIQPSPSASAKPFPSDVLGDLSRPSTNHLSNGDFSTSQKTLFYGLIDLIAKKFFLMSCLKCFYAKFESIAWLPVLDLS